MKIYFKPRGARGLTLLEMIVSIGVWILMVTAVGVIFERSLWVFRSVREKAAVMQEAKLASEWLVRDIRQGVSIATADPANITMVNYNPPCVSRLYYTWDPISQNITRKLGAGDNYLVARGITGLSLKYYDADNQLLSDPVVDLSALKMVEVDITAKRNNKSFHLNSVARFEYKPEFPWARAYGGTAEEYLHSIRQTSDGDYALGGRTASFGAGGQDVMFIKTNAAGLTQAVKTYGGAGADQAIVLAPTIGGGYVLAGVSNSFSAGGSSDILLLKTNATGALEWANCFGGAGSDYANHVQQASDGGYILGGYTSSFGTGNFDFLLLKTNATGALEWANTYGGSGWDGSFDLQYATDGGYILIGRTVVSFGTAMTDGLLLKTNATGALEWAKTYGGNQEDYLESIQVSSDGGYVFAGQTYSFGAGDCDVFLIKTDSSGNPQWAQAYGGSAADASYSVRCVADGGYVLGGRTTSFGVSGSQDSFLIKTNASGNLQWARTYGGSGWDNIADVRPIGDSGYAIAGNTKTFGAGNEDFFAVRTDALGEVGCCNVTQAVFPAANNVTSMMNVTNVTSSVAINNVTSLVSVYAPNITVTDVNITVDAVCP